MEFAYEADGIVTGLNRAGVAPELTGNCTPEELVWGMENDCYTATEGTLIPMTPLEKSEYDEAKAKAGKLIRDLNAVDKWVKEEQEKTFVYDTYNYYPDERGFNAVLTSIDYQPEGFEIDWKTADIEADGISNIYVTLDKTELIGLSLTLQARQAGLWAEGDTLKKQLKLDYNTGA